MCFDRRKHTDRYRQAGIHVHQTRLKVVFLHDKRTDEGNGTHHQSVVICRAALHAADKPLRSIPSKAHSKAVSSALHRHFKLHTRSNTLHSEPSSLFKSHDTCQKFVLKTPRELFHEKREKTLSRAASGTELTLHIPSRTFAFTTPTSQQVTSGKHEDKDTDLCQGKVILQQ